MKSLLTLCCLWLLCQYISCNNNKNVFIQDKVRFGNYFLQYGRFFESFLMILDLYESETYLFSNMNKEIAEETHLDTKTNNKTYISDIELNGIIVKDFKFKVKEDKDDQIDENDINGIIGLGIDNKGTNVFVNQLKEKGFINKRIVFITSKIFNKIEFLFDLKKKEIDQYHYINPIFSNNYKWHCRLSHIKIGNANNDFIPLPYNTISIFTVRNMFTEVPFDLLSLFKDKLVLQDCDEKIVNDASILVCTWSKEELLEHLQKDIIVVINGIGITIKGETLFDNYDSERKMLTISFKKMNQPIWNFGFKFIDDNSIALDYDNLKIGFRKMKMGNDNYNDHTDLFNDWMSNKGVSKSEKKWAYILFAIFEIITVLMIIFVIFIISRRYQYMSQVRNSLFRKSKLDEEPDINV